MEGEDPVDEHDTIIYPSGRGAAPQGVVRGFNKLPTRVGRQLMKPLNIRSAQDTHGERLHPNNGQLSPRSAGHAGRRRLLRAVDHDVEKAKPLNQVPTYNKLAKAAVKLASDMQGSMPFAAVAKQAHADDV